MPTLATSFGRNANVLRSVNPLTDEQIHFVAPSVFATEQHFSRSSKYTYIPTSFVLNGLRENGFMPVMVCQSKTREEHNREFTKHMLRFRHESQINVNNDTAKEVILINSHNGTCSYQLLAGVLRFVCQNGLVCGEEIADFSVRHSGDVAKNVIEGAYTVLDNFKHIDESMDAMKSITLDSAQQRAFAKSALTLCYGDLELSPINEDDILRPKRNEGKSNDQWTVFNRVQEWLTNGGIRDRNAQHKLVKTRPAKGIDGNIKLNRALWVLSEKMTKLVNR